MSYTAPPAAARPPEPPRCSRPQCRYPGAVVPTPTGPVCLGCAIKLKLPVPTCYGPCLMLVHKPLGIPGAWSFKYVPNLTEPVDGPQIGQVDDELPLATNRHDATVDAVNRVRFLGLPEPPEFRDCDWWQATDKETGITYHVLLNYAGEALASSMTDAAATVTHATEAELAEEEAKER